MYFHESVPDLPAFVTIASRGHIVLAFGHVEDLPSALRWCGRAMHLYSDAEQVALARPGYVELPDLGTTFMVMPFQGWIRAAAGWQCAGEQELQRFFDHVPDDGPRVLASVAPPSATGVMRSPARVRDTGSIQQASAGSLAVLRDSHRSYREAECEPRCGIKNGG
jgi:hypothetical protein